MADIKYYEEKVAKAEEKVIKCKKTIERHEKTLEKKLQKVSVLGVTLENLNEKRDEYRQTDHSWELYEVESKLSDIKGATKKLAEAEKVLENWKSKLAIEVEKERFLNNDAPQVIKDFLEKWKEMVFEWHIRRYDAYLKFAKELKAEVKKAEKELGVREGCFPNSEQNKKLKEMGLDYRTVEKKKASFAGAIVLQMCTYREKERLEWLDKTLEAEKKAKMLDLINRINAVVGTITDASELSISEKGNLDGYITGEKGKAKIETIGAGGWNVQVFHYRTLVHEVK